MPTSLPSQSGSADRGDGHVEASEQIFKEPLDHLARPPQVFIARWFPHVKFSGAEPEDLAAAQLEFAVGVHAGRVRGRVWPAPRGVVMHSVYLQHDTVTARQEEQEIHAEPQ